MASVPTTHNNSIVSLREVPFCRRNNRDKLATKGLGPPRPNLNIKQVSTKGGKAYNRGFSPIWYERKTWLAGCNVAGALFCFPCVLFHPNDGSGADTAWTTTGVTDMHHLSEKVKKHETSKLHMDSCLKFSAFGKVNIATQLDEGYRTAVRKHNDELQKKDIDAGFIKGALQRFTSSLQAIRDQDPSTENQQVAKGTTRPKRSLEEEEKLRLTKEVCDAILDHAKERFSFTNHLVGATLLQGDMFEQHCHTFPAEALNTTIMAYPMLNKAKLKTELSLIYESPEFKSCCGALALYQVLLRYNLQETFSETVTLLNILITTPMTTAEGERCFSTLKRIKTFLRNAMGQEHLNALAMLSMERELVKNMPDFNERVIDHFAGFKERQAKFQYK
ncbi:uncharacterized protein LOC143477109 isoform X3 [Brachyhypopomus gauderio]|uniref:uncharacterized protein LOC143477109 isoform X3 n=1 Tax=Brachyhypopomus gauderio TaxID=698409 RepID=UPI0040432659